MSKEERLALAKELDDLKALLADLQAASERVHAAANSALRALDTTTRGESDA